MKLPETVQIAGLTYKVILKQKGGGQVSPKTKTIQIGVGDNQPDRILPSLFTNSAKE